MLYVCFLCESCGSSQCCILHDLQFVNAGVVVTVLFNLHCIVLCFVPVLRGCAGQLHFLQNLELLFIPLQREESLIHPCTTQPAIWTCPHTNDGIPIADCCWREDWKIPAVSGCRQHGHLTETWPRNGDWWANFKNLEEAETRTAEKCHNGHV